MATFCRRYLQMYCILFNESFWISNNAFKMFSTKLSKHVPLRLIYNTSALVRIMALCPRCCIACRMVWYPNLFLAQHDDVMKWKHFPRYWPFVRGIHRSPVNSPHKGHWRGALMFSLICVWINGWVNNRETGDLRRHRAHYDVIVMKCAQWCSSVQQVFI